MLVNHTAKSIDIERRDVNYILPQYIRSYLFHMRNADPVEIVFPMFSAVPHPLKRGVMVPIRWVPELGPEGQAIAVEGSNVPEATEEEIARKDSLEEENKRLKEQIAALTSIARGEGGGEGLQAQEEATAQVAALTPAGGHQTVTEVVGEVAPQADRVPRQPEHPASGSPDDLHPRGRDDQKQMKVDLRPEPDIDESKQKPYSKKVKRGEKGEPIVEE